MRIATWNVNSLKARLEKLEAWLGEVEPDVVCLQETKCADDAYPALSLGALGYEGVHHGEGRWNGVAILSRVGIDDPVHGFADGGEADDQARLVTATCGGVRVSSVYVPNGRQVGHDHWHYKLAWFERLRAHLAVDASDRPRVVAGDFNVAPDDRDVWKPAAFAGSTHVSPEERAALAALMDDHDLVDVFRRHHHADGLFSWWDYRAGNFHKKKGMRIDLVLASADLAATSRWALVDRNARKGQAPSDHAPVVVELG